MHTYINEKENGLVQENQSAGTIYRVKCRPNDLLVEQELQANPRYNIDSLKQAYADCLYFTLSISQDSSEIFSRQRENFIPLLKKISFQLNDEISLVKEKGEVFYLADFIYPRTYGATPNTSVLLCFKNKAFTTPGNLTLYIKDFVNESSESLRFTFRKQDINNIPLLKLQNT